MMINGAKRVLMFNKINKLGQKLVTHIVGENYQEPWEVVDVNDEYIIYSMRLPTTEGESRTCYKIEFCVEGKF